MKAGEVVAGKYQLEVRLGIGGMGEVWKATHAGTGREFALKFMHPHVATSSTARQRFAREARVSARINHPNVIDIFDVGEAEDHGLYLAMELLEGVSLADAFHAAEPLSVRDLVTILLDSARALAAAHAVGVVHRDIKPGNIFLHKDRASGFAVAKILDFGISKLGDGEHTKTGAVLGSPRYMSPEQARSAANVDARTDLWPMGVILFEGLTGTWPHDGDSFSSLVLAICTLPPLSIDVVAPGLPEPLRAIVRDCLRPRDQRIAGAAELADRLAAVVTDPLLAQMALPRPLNPPSDGAKSVSGVRVRPPLHTTTGGVVIASTASAPSEPAPRVHDAPHAAAPREGSPLARPAADDEDATRVRPLPSRGEVSALLAAPQVPAASKATIPMAAIDPPLGADPSSAVREIAPLFQASAKTIPINAGPSLHAELVRAGIAQPSTSAAPHAAPPAAASPFALATPPPAALGAPQVAAITMPSQQAPVPVPARAPRSKALGVIAAALSVLLAAIVTALILVLRSPAPAPLPASSAPPDSAAPAERSAPAASVAAPPSVEPAPPSAPPPASASAPPLPRPASPPRPPPKPGSKVKQLGSGL